PDTVGEADELLVAFGCRADNHEQALRIVLEPGLHVDAVCPEIDVALDRQIPLLPARVLVRPNVPEPCDGRGREPTSILAEQRCQRLLEPACGDPLEVEDRDQYLETFRAARVRRQDRGAEGNALLARADPVTNARSAHRDRADAGHNLALGQMTVAHQPLTSIVGELVGVALEKPGHLRRDGLGQKRAGTAAQHLSQRVGKRAWLGKLENITVGHGVSLLRWRNGGANTSTIRRLTLSYRHQLLRIAHPYCPRARGGVRVTASAIAPKSKRRPRVIP